jgi:hypothetical protein
MRNKKTFIIFKALSKYRERALKTKELKGPALWGIFKLRLCPLVRLVSTEEVGSVHLTPHRPRDCTYLIRSVSLFFLFLNICFFLNKIKRRVGFLFQLWVLPRSNFADFIFENLTAIKIIVAN